MGIKILEQIFGGIDKLFGGKTPEEKRKEKHEINQQIRDYKAQTEVTKNEINRAKDEQIAEKRRIQEKQIRALRGRSSSRGFLGITSPEAGTPGMSSQLGG